MPGLDEAAAETRKEKEVKKSKPQRDAAREAVETIVFVVVLVLLLKLFVTEAFVIPTGSMAETLYGYHKMVICPKCGHEFPVNSHDEVEGNQTTGRKTPLYGFCCPNCRYLGHVSELDPAPHNQSGDRVLVLKPLYNIEDPKRGDVVVFKYPAMPQEKQTASNYIKRAEGFGGETIAIYQGDLYVTRSLKYPESEFPHPTDELKLWEPQYMYPTISDTSALMRGSNQLGMKLFKESRDNGFAPGRNGGFEIVRKGEKQLLADRRIVWDNDKQPKELAGHVPSRWYVLPEGSKAWTQNDNHQPQAFSHIADDLHWIRYRHLSKQWKTIAPDGYDQTLATNLAELASQPAVPIDNFLGYNAGRDLDTNAKTVTAHGDNSGSEQRWVGDLILECEVELEAGAEVVLELSKGVNRFQAIFGNGRVTLNQTGRGAENFKKPSRSCKAATGKYKLRFANVDCRLWAWVDGRCIDFGDESNYLSVEPLPSDGADPEGWVKANDVDAPASIGAKGKSLVSHIVLHRDIYYTYTHSDSKWYRLDSNAIEKMTRSGVPVEVLEKIKPLRDKIFSTRSSFDESITELLSRGERDNWLRTLENDLESFAGADIFYVQPGHFLCLGDNSAQSSDSRKWGTVPERLMLGKAVFVFFPRGRIGFIK